MVTIETTDKTVTVNGLTTEKGGFTIQEVLGGHVSISTPTGQNLRTRISDIEIDGEVPTDYSDLISKAQGLFKTSGTDSSDVVQSITGDLVDDTDPQNPVINNPTWAQVSGKPTTFAPAAHTHEIADVNGLQGALDDKLESADALQIGTTATTAKAGNYQPTWAQVTSKPTEFTPSSHTHPFSEVTGTATAAQIPTLAISKISGLQGELDGKLTAVQGAAVADAVDETDVVAQFNALLASLRTAGIIAV